MEESDGRIRLSQGYTKMPRFLVLLRGVNVGKGNRVPMAEFGALLEGLGYTSVKTLLNSGNAVFSSRGGRPPQHAAQIAKALGERLGVSVPTIVKSAREIAAIVEGNPIPPPDGGHSQYLVAFGPDAGAIEGLTALRPLIGEAERFAITSEAAYLDCAGSLLGSQAATALLGRLGRGVTTRNWATVLKLAALLDEKEIL